MGVKMSTVKVPRSLRFEFANSAAGLAIAEIDPSRTAAVACMIAAATIGSAEAQQQLEPVTIDAPVTRPRSAAKPTPTPARVRTAVRRAATRAPRQQNAAPAASPNSGAATAAQGPASRDPYADPAAPYKADRLSSSSKFPMPILDTPKSITVLTKEVLEDKKATTLREVGRTTAGITLGTGEGGNAFGDRFFIRGFDARNDIFIDGVRDPAVSIRENFFTEQVEILRGPGSSFAGRGTTGGAINIVTKQARDQNFYEAETTLGTDRTKRITLDVNQVIDPTLSIRVNGMGQDANVAGRNYIFDDRWGGLAAVKWTPTNDIKVTANYIHTDLNALPDFGVPYFRPSTLTQGAPFTEVGVPRNNFYGFVNRDFQKTKQDIGTLNAQYDVNNAVSVTNKFRVERSVLNYLGTLPEGPVITNPNPLLWTVSANPQSRYQVTDVIANQTEGVFKFDTGPWRNYAVAGVEISRETISRNSYTGLTSEALPGGFNGNGSLAGVNIFNPQLGFGQF